VNNRCAWAAAALFFLAGALLAQQALTAKPSTRNQSARGGEAKGKEEPINRTAQFEFRGIRLGMTSDEARTAVQARFPRGKDVDARVPGLVPCGDYRDIDCRNVVVGAQSCSTFTSCSDKSGGKRQSLSLDFVDGKLAVISFHFPHDAMPAEWTRNSIGVSFDNYAGIRSAILEKYGDGHVTRNDVQTDSGAHYSSEDSLWDHGTSTLELEELCVNIKQSCLRIIDKGLAEEFYKRFGAAQKPDI
jgi:hypothetical protein